MAVGERDGNVGPVTKGGADKEAELLGRLLADESAAWRELVTLYSGLLMEVSKRTFKGYQMSGTDQDHEDVVAAVWGNLLEDDKRVVRQCLAQGGLLARLHVMTKHRAVDLVRKKGMRSEVGGEEVEEMMEGMAAPEMSGEGVDEAGQGDVKKERVTEEALAAAMEQLSERQRTLVRLFYLQNKAYKEIEALTGVAQNSIGPTIKRAVERLREILK
jgi:RNA polymerase sigma-70 factor, ECF subfamily